jgi:hypothetical protein
MIVQRQTLSFPHRKEENERGEAALKCGFSIEAARRSYAVE